MAGQKADLTAGFLRVTVVDHAKKDSPEVNIKAPVGVVTWG
jgi:hypothetical protein